MTFLSWTWQQVGIPHVWWHWTRMLVGGCHSVNVWCLYGINKAFVKNDTCILEEIGLGCLLMDISLTSPISYHMLLPLICTHEGLIPLSTPSCGRKPSQTDVVEWEGAWSHEVSCLLFRGKSSVSQKVVALHATARMNMNHNSPVFFRSHRNIPTQMSVIQKKNLWRCLDIGCALCLISSIITCWCCCHK